jgi:AcrR family transcriptional regulator
MVLVPGTRREADASSGEEAAVATEAGSPAAARPLRRVPVQGRSVARVQRMLDACAGLIDEVGYEGLTTTLLAERAGVAIGSVYQFFPDKRAIVQALTVRNLEAYLDRLSARFAEGEFAQWWDGVDAGIDEYIALHRSLPGFRTLHFGDVVDVHLLDPERDNNAVIADELARLLTTHFNLADNGRLGFALAIAVEAGDALIKMAFRRDHDGDEAVLAEAKELIREYLHRQVDRPVQRRKRQPKVAMPAFGGPHDAPDAIGVREEAAADAVGAAVGAQATGGQDAHAGAQTEEAAPTNGMALLAQVATSINPGGAFARG